MLQEEANEAYQSGKDISDFVMTTVIKCHFMT